MKPICLLSALVVSLLPLTSGAEVVKISTSVFKMPDSMNLPGQVRIISEGEWQPTLRTLAQTKGTDLWTAPAAKTPSGKMARLDFRISKPGGFWHRNEEPEFPISSIEYTPKETRGGIDLRGDFKLNPGSTSDKNRSETVTAANVHGLIPQGMLLTFVIEGHIVVVRASKVEK